MTRAGILKKLTWGLIAFSSVTQAAIVVNMQVNDNETKLTVTTPGNCVRGANTTGCVKGQGQQPINFNLGNKRCSSGGNWSLDYVALGMSENSTGGLTEVAASDFNADVSTGRVTPNNQNPNQIQIRNNNMQAYDVWYTVYATCGDAVIDTDPRIENDGSGHQ
jgi:hypothetical protein